MIQEECSQPSQDTPHSRDTLGFSTHGPTPALRLSRFFGTTAAFWMNAQLACDLFEAERVVRE